MDDNTLSARLQRYLSVTSGVAGVAARYVGSNFSGTAVDAALASDLRVVLGSLKGPLMKIAQLVASIPNALPPAYAQELMQLQANAPPMGELFVQRRLRQELGGNWQDYFQTFDLTAAAAASLGQVHRATLKDSAVVACKLQYPGMSAAIEADLHQLKLAGGIYEMLNRAITTADIHAEIADRLREELDYLLEARHIELYRYMLRSQHQVQVPRVWTDLTTERLLTMSWLEGQRLIDFAQNTDTAHRTQVAKVLFKAWYVPFYHYGVIHGDPHLGNYTVTSEGTVNLLDFGCVRKFPPRFVKGVIDLYWALQKDDNDLAVHAYEQWGFENLSHELIDVLNLWARFLYAPLLTNSVCALQDINDSAHGRAVAEQVHQELKRLGGVKPPREFVFMDRAAVGVGGALMHLNVEANWHELFHDIIDGFDADTLAQRQQTALQAAGL